jgi:phosphoribosylformimino-5-aminoimidazole carboxamide ribotide isomerase
MKIIPAIDIKGGQCVRLIQGDYDQVTRYDKSPPEQAIIWQQMGAEMIHLVDLDGAKSGKLINLKIIEEVVSRVDVPVEVGGGIRTTEAVEAYDRIGVSRIIIGTAALKNPDWLKEMVQRYPEKICVSIDASNGMIATDGWTSVSDVSAQEYILKLESWGVKTIVYTDIAKDGMLSGPNFEIYKQLSEISDIQIIASGGITRIEDVITLKQMDVYGAIIGKALYEGYITLKEAISC